MFRVEQTSALEERTGTRERVVAVGFINHRERRVEFERGEYGRGGEEEGDGESENVVSESRRKRRGEILRDCESKDKRCGRVREKRRRGMREGWGYEVSTYATLRDDGNRESREVGFRTVSGCIR